MKVLKYTSIVFICIIYLYLNIWIHIGPDLSEDSDVISDAKKQLVYLETQIKKENMADRMQEIFPEGYMFTYLLYGLSYCELARIDESTYEKAIHEARMAYKQINSEKGYSIFPKNQKLEYGIFYRGWKNYLLAKILLIDKDTSKNAKDYFTSECEAIKDAFEDSAVPFLESYSDGCWPVDAFPAIASLAISDQIYDMKYDKFIREWIKKVRNHLDPQTGLLPHMVNSQTGEIIDGARGSSSSMSIRFLSEIDGKFTHYQMINFIKELEHSVLGFPATREYPKGNYGKGDVDSGPVVFGIGFSATIVSIGTFKSCGLNQKANLLSNTIETYGFPRNNTDGKKYIFGKLPIADAFICWSRLANPQFKLSVQNFDTESNSGSYFKIHLWSSMIFLIICFLLMYKEILKKIKLELE